MATARSRSNSALNYFGPAFDVAVGLKPLKTGEVRPIGSGNLLEILGASQDANQVSINQLVQSVEVELPLGTGKRGSGVPSCTVEITAPYDVALVILDSFIVDYGNYLLITLGYSDVPDALTEQFVFYQQANPGVNFGLQTQITLKGVGLGSQLPRRGRTGTWKTSQKSRKSIIFELARLHYLHVDFSRLGTKTGGRLDGKMENDTTQSGESDFAFLRKLLADVQATFVIEGDTLVLLDRNEIMREELFGTLAVFGQIDTAKGIWPAHQFAVEGSQWFKPRMGIAQDVRRGYDPKDGLNHNTPPVSVPDADGIVYPATGRAGTAGGIKSLERPPFQLKSGNTTKKLYGEYGLRPIFTEEDKTKIQGARTTAELALAYMKGVREEERRKSYFEGDAKGDTVVEGPEDKRPGRTADRNIDGSETTGMSATATTPGNPYLRPGQLLQVKGAGRYDVVFRIQKVTHQIDSGGFNTSLMLITNTSVDTVGQSTVDYVPGRNTHKSKEGPEPGIKETTARSIPKTT